jgi:hypothetical protein
LATLIIEDVAVVTVIVLFAWLVPARQNGIPGLGGRGRTPVAVTKTRPEPIRPRPVPAAERIVPADAGSAGGQRERDRDQDARVLAELDKTWAPGYADRVAAQVRERKGRR